MPSTAVTVFDSAAPDATLVVGPVPAEATQLIVSVSEGWTGRDAVLQRYERQQGKPWKPIGQPIQSTIGHAGLGWGRGLHPPPKADEPIKHEGDGRSPAGAFLIGRSYGYDKAPAGTTLPYEQVTRNWRCVSDAKSTHYNRVLDRQKITNDWRSAERMRRRDTLYEYVIEVDHNHIVPAEVSPTPGDGSCIFLHVWDQPGAPTIGCTAMPLSAMRTLLEWLRPTASPVLVALPREHYEILRNDWGLPGLPAASR